MIPLKDENPTSRPAVITLLIIAACIGIYFFVQPTGQMSLVEKTRDDQLEELEFTFKYAAIPCEVVTGDPLTVDEVGRTVVQGDSEACIRDDTGRQAEFPDKRPWLSMLFSMFLHGGLLHLGGNMLFMWVFGNNIEDRMKVPLFVAFYVLSGLAATLTHVALQPDSTIPLVGASGAIAGVMGAYLVLFPNAPIKTFVIFYFIFFREISAKWLLGFWFVSQFFISPNSGVAWAAHVGGFVFGAIVALLFRDRLRPPRRVQTVWNY